MPAGIDLVPESIVESLETFSVGRYDGAIEEVSPLTYEEAHNLMNSYAELDCAGVMNAEYYIHPVA